jgi:hypothetical protein
VSKGCQIRNCRQRRSQGRGFVVVGSAKTRAHASRHGLKALPRQNDHPIQHSRTGHRTLLVEPGACWRCHLAHSQPAVVSRHVRLLRTHQRRWTFRPQPCLERHAVDSRYRPSSAARGTPPHGSTDGFQRYPPEFPTSTLSQIVSATTRGARDGGICEGMQTGKAISHIKR